jgi:hypothetical protein
MTERNRGQGHPLAQGASPHDIRAHLNLFAELRTLLEVSPWSGDPANANNPDAPVRMLTFGPQHEGMVTYLFLEDQGRVDVLQVGWLG